MSDDARAARQPVGYWTGVAHRAVVAFVREAIAGQGLTQPQWWALNHLTGAGLTRAELAVALRARLESLPPGEAELDPLVDGLVAAGWAAPGDGDRLRLTGPGEERRERVLAAVTEARARTHEGVSEAEYAAALAVLRRMIRNVGGDDRLL